MISKWARLVRVSEWSYSKAGLCLLPLLWEQAVEPENLAFFSWIGALLFLGGFFSAAYLENDICDKQKDSAAGKYRVVHDLSSLESYALLLLHLAASILGILILGPVSTKLAYVGIALSYSALFTYSRQPIRLKERGVAGLLVAAAGQRVFPMMVLSSAAPRLRLAGILLMGLAFAEGIRWIFIHQVLDIDADRRSGVQTWATRHGPIRLKSILLRAILPSEVLLAVLFVIMAIPVIPTLLPVLVFYSIGAIFMYRGQARKGNQDIWFSYDYAPGSNFLLFAIPTGLLVTRSSLDSAWVGAVFAYSLTSFSYLRWQAQQSWDLMFGRA